MANDDTTRPGDVPAVDRTGGRGDLPSAAHVESVPEPLRQGERESDQAHTAFLLYAMQAPDDRSNRLIARTLGTAESNVRHWRTKYRWKERMAAVPNVEWIALDVYRRRMDEHAGKARADRLRIALDVVLDTAGFASLRREVQRQRTAKPSRLDTNVPAPDSTPEAAPVVTPNAYASPLAQNEIEQIDPARAMRDLLDQVQSKHLRYDDLKRQIVLIDAVLGLVAQKVRSGDLKVRVADIPHLLRARAVLTGLPTDGTLVQQPVQVQHAHAHVHVVESVRMRDARAAGGGAALVEAMREEVDDLQVILAAVPAQKGA